jgi:hypothetical protein
MTLNLLSRISYILYHISYLLYLYLIFFFILKGDFNIQKIANEGYKFCIYIFKVPPTFVKYEPSVQVPDQRFLTHCMQKRLGGAVHLLPQEVQQDSWSYKCIICECVPFDSSVKL